MRRRKLRAAAPRPGGRSPGPLLLALCTALAGPLPAAASRQGEVLFAYIDPGTGSFLIQSLIAAIAGVAVALRLYWRRIKVFLGLGPRHEDDPDHTPHGSNDDP
ncbi:MAG: hypothetical protein MJE66_09530 [Proteobacteria bacterium]|nr:hypothetical protein [Pseudomonadota bacterium]